MHFGVIYHNKRYPVDVTADYHDDMEMMYFAHTQESYECLDDVRRSFTGQGKTLRDALNEVLKKVITHQPQ